MKNKNGVFLSELLRLCNPLAKALGESYGRQGQSATGQHSPHTGLEGLFLETDFNRQEQKDVCEAAASGISEDGEEMAEYEITLGYSLTHQ